jgi:hypothetical protein
LVEDEFQELKAKQEKRVQAVRESIRMAVPEMYRARWEEEVKKMVSEKVKKEIPKKVKEQVSNTFLDLLAHPLNPRPQLDLRIPQQLIEETRRHQLKLIQVKRDLHNAFVITFPPLFASHFFYLERLDGTTRRLGRT